MVVSTQNTQKQCKWVGQLFVLLLCPFHFFVNYGCIFHGLWLYIHISSFFMLPERNAGWLARDAKVVSSMRCLVYCDELLGRGTRRGEGKSGGVGIVHKKERSRGWIVAEKKGATKDGMVLDCTGR